MEAQTAKIIRHLNDFRTITAAEAMADYGIMRLAARIADLRKMGYPVESRVVCGKNRFGEPIRYAEYSWGARNEADKPV